MSIRLALLLATLVSAAPAIARAQAAPPRGAPADTAAAPAMTPAPPTSAAFPRGRISGLTFGDLYWNASGDPRHVVSVGTGTDSGKVNLDASGRPITRDLNGLQIRRVYFQLDNDLSPRYATRLRFELDGRSLTADGKIAAFLKNAYVEAKELWPRGDAMLGMVATPTWENAEEFWQYRAIEKTVGDFLGLGPATDLGMRASGYLDAGRRLGYVAMVGDGSGQKPENNRDKRFYLAVPLRLTRVIVEPYADYENAPASRDRATYKLFAGAEPGRLGVGLELYDQVRHAPAGNAELRAASLFARWAATPGLGAFARADVWDPDVRVPDRVREWLWIAGLDWQPHKDVHVMPNVEYTQYDARGAALAPPWHDLQARLTFYYKFAKPQS